MSMSSANTNDTKDAKANAAPNDLLVKKEIFVKTTRERAFDVFTKQMKAWWPLATHHLGQVKADDVVLEPRVGGRWYEKRVDATECDWGVVLAWDPPAGLVLSWDIDADWKPDAALKTEVDIQFFAENGGTRVTVEHRLLSRYGARAEEVRAALDSDGGWSFILAELEKHVHAA